MGKDRQATSRTALNISMKKKAAEKCLAIIFEGVFRMIHKAKGDKEADKDGKSRHLLKAFHGDPHGKTMLS